MTQEKDLIINEWEKGIAISPHKGFEDIRNLDILTNPGAVMLNFKTTALNTPPTVTTLAYTTDTTTDVVTVASTTNWYNGMAITLDTVVTSTGISTGRVYWVGDLTATTFKLYNNPNLNSARLVDITGSNGSGTLSSYVFGQPIDKAVWNTGTGALQRPYVFILDSNGRVWWIKNDGGSLTTNLVYLGNDTLTSSGSGRAIAIHSQDIVVFRAGHIDRLNCTDIENTSIDFDSGSGWEYGVDTVSGASFEPRATFTANDNVLYFDNDGKLGSFADDYTKTTIALQLPTDERITSIGEIGNNLLVATARQYIYPWDKVLSSYYDPIIVPELKTSKVVSAGQLAYLFAGDSGRIYVTNGVTVEFYKKIPDHITGHVHPIFTWVDALAFDNQLYFSFSATDNSGNALSTVGGVWAIDRNTQALRLAHQMSYGSYAGTTHLLIPNVLDNDNFGSGLIVAWANGSSYGVDYGSTSYYTDYAGYLISPLYTVSNAKDNRTFNQADIIFENELATGGGVKLSFRRNRTDSFSDSQTIDFATYGNISHINLNLPGDDLVSCQIKVEFTGTTTTPIIKEIRLR